MSSDSLDRMVESRLLRGYDSGSDSESEYKPSIVSKVAPVAAPSPKLTLERKDKLSSKKEPVSAFGLKSRLIPMRAELKDLLEEKSRLSDKIEDYSDMIKYELKKKF